MEQEPIEFYERVCEAYRELARREAGRGSVDRWLAFVG